MTLPDQLRAAGVLAPAQGGPDAFETARDFAEHGYSVLPLHGIRDGLCTCSEGPNCSSPGKHPRLSRGLTDATADERQLLLWDDRWPGSNWAVVCDRFAVVDLDPRHGADVERLLDEWSLRGPAVTTGVVLDGPQAGEIGRHIYVAGPARTITAAKPGVDVRGTGSYVVLPGSRHASGTTYSWDDDARPWRGLPALPAALQQQAPSPERTQAEPGAVIPAGARNASLASHAGRLRRVGASREAIELDLLAVNARQCRPPLPEPEVKRIASSIARYAPAEPPVAVSATPSMFADPERVKAARANASRILGLGPLAVIRLIGRGTDARAEITPVHGPGLILDPLNRFSSPTKLTQEIAAQTSVVHPVTAKDIPVLFGALAVIGDHMEGLDRVDIARDLGASYLRRARTIEFTDDQLGRWRAFRVLEQEPEPRLDSALPVAEQAPVLVERATGERWVRTGWFRVHLRQHGADATSTINALLGAGWTKQGRDGSIHARSPASTEQAVMRFLRVPRGWEHEAPKPIDAEQGTT